MKQKEKRISALWNLQERTVADFVWHSRSAAYPSSGALIHCCPTLSNVQAMTPSL